MFWFLSSEIDLKDASKFFAGKFSCGCSISGDDEIVIQGDVKDDMFDILPQKWKMVCGRSYFISFFSPFLLLWWTFSNLGHHRIHRNWKTRFQTTNCKRQLMNVFSCIILVSKLKGKIVHFVILTCALVQMILIYYWLKKKLALRKKIQDGRQIQDGRRKIVKSPNNFLMTHYVR